MAAWLFTEVVTHDLLFAHGWFPHNVCFFASPDLDPGGRACETGASIFGDSAAWFHFRSPLGGLQRMLRLARSAAVWNWGMALRVLCVELRPSRKAARSKRE